MSCDYYGLVGFMWYDHKVNTAVILVAGVLQLHAVDGPAVPLIRLPPHPPSPQVAETLVDDAFTIIVAYYNNVAFIKSYCASGSCLMP